MLLLLIKAKFKLNQEILQTHLKSPIRKRKTASTYELARQIMTQPMTQRNLLSVVKGGPGIAVNAGIRHSEYLCRTFQRQ